MKNFLIIAFVLFTTVSVAQINIVQRSHLTFPGKVCSNIWGYTDSLGREYALVGTSTGVSIVDVTNPDTAILKVNVTGISSSWREIKTWGKYAYVTTEGCCNGLQIINLSYLPDSAPMKYYTGDGAIAGLLARAHALHIDNGYAYIYGCNTNGSGYLQAGSAIILNLANPWNPVYTGNTNTPGLNNYVHDGYVRNDTLYAGNIYGGYFSIFNVANKSAPVLINTQATPTNFTHHTWLNTSGSVLFTTDETNNSFLAAYDVSDPGNIKFLDKIQSVPGIVHNVTVKNNFAITSYYRQGVIIFDVDRPSNLCQVGNFDTSPAYTGNGYNGCWGVYPFFPSGNIIASDIEQGLYVLTPNYLRACYLEGTVTDTITGQLLSGAIITVAGTSLTETTIFTGSYTLSTLTAGTYTVQVSKPGYATKTITGVVLSNGVLTNLNIRMALPRLTLTGTILKTPALNPAQVASLKLSGMDETKFSTTDSSGNFSIPNVYPGSYELTYGKWKYSTSCNSISVDSMHTVFNGSITLETYDDFTFNYGWVVTGPATTGKWIRAVPLATTYATVGDANPGNDVGNDCSNLCFVTGNGSSGVNADDVDNQITTLTSPVFSVFNYTDPYINYSRWFFGSPGSNDTLIVKLSNGTTTVVLENVTSNVSNNSQWVAKSFKVTNYLTPTKKMKLILTIKDRSPGHTLEAGLDKFYVTDNAPPVNSGEPQNKTSNDAGVFPNPFDAFINVDLNAFKNCRSVTLSDVTGKVISENVLSGNETEFQLTTTHLRSGIYFISIKDDTTVVVKKVVKQ